MKICPKCNAEHQKAGTFCSRKCANSRVFSDETKAKKSIANKEHFAAFGSAPNGMTGRKKSAESIEKQVQSHKDRTDRKYREGTLKDPKTIRRKVIEERGYCCERCGISEWNGEPIALQVDHTDGDATNNIPTNLRLLCPNCHSQTETWGSKNKGFGRKARGLPY